MSNNRITDFKNLNDNQKDLLTVNIIKGLVMDGVRNANSGHPGGPMSLADFTYILYSEFLTIDPKNPCLLYTSPSPRDRYISRMPSSA